MQGSFSEAGTLPEQALYILSVYFLKDNGIAPQPCSTGNINCVTDSYPIGRIIFKGVRLCS